MKNILLIILALSFASSCTTFRTDITPYKVFSPILDNEPVMFYFNDQKLPDSSEYVGEITSTINNVGFDGITIRSLISKVENDVKSYGANAIQLYKKQEDDSRDEIFKGKLFRLKPFGKISIDIDSFKLYLLSNKDDEYEGIYEIPIDEDERENRIDSTIKILCMKKDSINYELIYLSGYTPNKSQIFVFDLYRIWKKGDVYAYLYKTVNKNIYKAFVYSFNKCLDKGAFIKFKNGNLYQHCSRGCIHEMTKIFPDSTKPYNLKGSLTGFAINNNRIITCYHALNDNDIKIYVKGINNDFENRMEAVIEKFDEILDIAILRLVDSSVTLNQENFQIINEEKGVADEVYVLGYPMSVIMGDEIKLTNGIISSKSGFAGDISMYQITAAVQPGNSGAPLFDKKGALIGMINSKLMYADNVAYSLKATYLKDFLKNSGYKSVFENSAINIPVEFSEHVKSFQKSIYIIEIIDTKENTNKRKQSKGRMDRYQK
ncbi:MAG: trypsin-like peptidase domain-containing protein [Ignavibacteriae bacterium]|nr:trypsin-like peptidase domain-containing protein [Ignavibacteriota bacterium]